MMKCPNCGKENDDNWPLLKGNDGCQECWEEESDLAWWEAVVTIGYISDNGHVTIR